LSQQFTVIAHLVAQSGKVEDAKAIMLSLIERTRLEEGCIDYHLHQAVDNPTEFVFYENWSSRQTWEQHLEMPHLKDFISRAGELLEGEPKIHQMAMISGRSAS
jgi:quinol monooxygenase YgiN